jgi:hypothetical protein
MQRSWREALLTVGTLAVLVLILISVDDNVRDQLSMRATTPGVVSAGRDVRALTTVIAVAVREQSVAHAPLVIFGVAAAVLVIFMLRT